MSLSTRRDFNSKLLASLAAYGLIDALWSSHCFADGVKPIVGKWLADLAQLCQDVKGQKIKDVEWQAKIEELYGKVDLPALCQCLDLDRLAERAKLPDNGAASLGVDLSKVEGLPKIVFGKQIFGLKKGRAVVPHGHDNMCTAFIVLRGDFRGRHYDRVEDNKDHYLIKPTSDRKYRPGEPSTISDHKDNVHWFIAESEPAFIFNIHVLGYNPENKKSGNRVYVDPEGEKTSAGLIVAKKMSSAECHKKYG
jgi:hypothetical protein